MKKQDYTHYAKFYGIPCYYNVDTFTLDGRNILYEFFLNIAIWIEKEFPSNPDGFPIEIGKEINQVN